MRNAHNALLQNIQILIKYNNF